MDSNYLETVSIGQIEQVRGPAQRPIFYSDANLILPQLVLTLYEPNEPAVIAATQATLTQLQNSPRAWSIARDLLSCTDEKVKFHGALIIIIKLNTER